MATHGGTTMSRASAHGGSSARAETSRSDAHRCGSIIAFHGTRNRSTVDAITKGNFDTKFIGSQTDSGWWGRGFYFSEFPGTSLGYGANMLLCRVLPGKTFDVSVRMDGKPLKTGYNSHRLHKDANGYGQELVIDNPKQILPCYILHVQ